MRTLLVIGLLFAGCGLHTGYLTIADLVGCLAFLMALLFLGVCLRVVVWLLGG